MKDEIRNALSIVRTSILPALVDLYEEWSGKIGSHGHIAPLLKMGSWLGGDRDGHPGVTPEVTAMMLEKLRAGEIAETAEFFSFGTNDLTQTTFGLSRDDSGSFLQYYQDRGIFEKDPFASLDRDGVGELVQIAAERGRKTRGNIKLGICGEHGGDPASIAFCERTGLDYVSASPYRVPIARLAAAQAALKVKA